MTTQIDRRELLQASAAVPMAAVVQKFVDTKLTQDELRMLAMCATPAERLVDAEAYNKTRAFSDDRGDSRTIDMLEELERRSLVYFVRNYNRHYDCDRFAVATDAGLAELRHLGVIA